MGGPPYVEGDNGTGPGRARVEAARLWTGGLATAAIGLVSGEGWMENDLYNIFLIKGTEHNV